MQRKGFDIMANDFMIKLMAELDKANSRKKMNEGIRQLEKTIDRLHVIATLYKGECKKEINAVISEMSP